MSFLLLCANTLCQVQRSIWSALHKVTTNQYRCMTMHAPIVFHYLSLLTIMVQVQARSYMPEVCGKVVCNIVQRDLCTWQRVFAHSNRRYTLSPSSYILLVSLLSRFQGRILECIIMHYMYCREQYLHCHTIMHHYGIISIASKENNTHCSLSTSRKLSWDGGGGDDSVKRGYGSQHSYFNNVIMYFLGIHLHTPMTVHVMLTTNGAYSLYYY